MGAMQLQRPLLNQIRNVWHRIQQSRRVEVQLFATQLPHELWTIKKISLSVIQFLVVSHLEWSEPCRQRL